MKFTDILTRLQAVKGSGAWQRIAKASNLDYFTVARIARGEIENPGVLTCERIAEAIKKEGATHGKS